MISTLRLNAWWDMFKVSIEDTVLIFSDINLVPFLIIFNRFNSHLDTVFSFLTSNIYFPTRMLPLVRSSKRRKRWWRVKIKWKLKHAALLTCITGFYWFWLAFYTDFFKKPTAGCRELKAALESLKLVSTSYEPFSHIVAPWILTRHEKLHLSNYLGNNSPNFKHSWHPSLT